MEESLCTHTPTPTTLRAHHTPPRHHPCSRGALLNCATPHSMGEHSSVCANHALTHTPLHNHSSAHLPCTTSTTHASQRIACVVRLLLDVPVAHRTVHLQRARCPPSRRRGGRAALQAGWHVFPTAPQDTRVGGWAREHGDTCTSTDAACMLTRNTHTPWWRGRFSRTARKVRGVVGLR